MIAQLRVDFQGRSKVETFSRARVQPMGDGVQLPYSCVYRISFAWQHRSPSGREVLHLELELKPASRSSRALSSNVRRREKGGGARLSDFGGDCLGLAPI
jgi:hypothetical protein